MFLLVSSSYPLADKMVLTLKLLAKIAFLSLACATLQACENQVYGAGLIPQNVSGDENGVSVFNVWSASDAQPLADRHCRQHDKEAVFDHSAPITMFFKCV